MAKIPEFFGLNLGHNSLKLAQVQSINGQKVRLFGLASIPTTFGILDNDSTQGVDLLAKEISDAVKKSSFKTRNCVMAVPETSVFSRLLTLPKVKDSEVSESIHWATKPLIPAPLEDVNISFLPIDEKRVGDNVYVNWYVVAAPKTLVTKFRRVMEKADINLFAIETEALALARITQFELEEKNKDVLVLDFGAESTNVVLARNGVVMFSQTINTGSNSLTEVIASDFGLDKSQAEKYKLNYGLDFTSGEGKIAKSIEPVINILVGEIQRTIDYYREKIGGIGIFKIFLTGGGAGLPQLDTFIKEKTGFETSVLETLKNIEIPPGINFGGEGVGIRNYCVSIGLALKGLI